MCFDATRFGCGLDGAVELAIKGGIPAVSYSFAPFPVASKTTLKLEKTERNHLQELAHKCLATDIEISSLSLDYCLYPEDKKSCQKFLGMLKKLFLVAEAVGCSRVGFSVKPGDDDLWKTKLSELLNQALAARDSASSATSSVRLMLRLSTPAIFRGQSLKSWRGMEPQDWRDLLSLVPDLTLSFSPADCVWLGIDYLRILSGVVKAVEQIEAHDIEISRDLLTDSGMYGPLWWRYRSIGKGQVDWRQFIELLKLYEFGGAVSLQLDDEFLSDDQEELRASLDTSIKFMAPLLRG
jgi:sugar phosphate isomerase/epimerase